PLAARELALLAINSNRSETRTSALEALRDVSNLHNDVELAALVAEIYIRIGQPEAAWQTIEPFLDTQLPAVLRIAGIARLLLDTDPTRGSDMYLGGLAVAIAAFDARLYYDDIRLILTSAERNEWLSLTGSHNEWLIRMWEWRAKVAGVK